MWEVGGCGVVSGRVWCGVVSGQVCCGVWVCVMWSVSEWVWCGGWADAM